MSIIKKAYDFAEIDQGDFFRQSVWSKGELLFKANHIDKVLETFDKNKNKISTITAVCLPQTNISKQPYSIILEINENRKIIKGCCSCKAGIVAQCKHSAALVNFINNQVNDECTAIRQVWGVPKRIESYKKGSLICDLFPSKSITTKEIDEAPLFIQVKLESINDNCPLYDILFAESSQEEEKICHDVINGLVCQVEKSILEEHISEILISAHIEEIICNQTFLTNISAADREFYEKEICVDDEKILQLAVDTVQQSLSDLWFTVRKNRLTGTKCHKIKTRKNNFDKLLTQMKKPFKGNTTTAYGVRMEKIASQKYCEVIGKPLVNCGAIISRTHPWLCFSPDGFLKTDSGEWILVEIKCPYKRKDAKITSVNVSFVPYLVFLNGKFCLKETHEYYTQVQIGLFISNLQEAHFVVFSSVDIAVVEGK